MEAKNKIWLNFLSPPVLAVVITGIMAPMVGSCINEDIHKKEMQLDIVQSIIRATEKDDFSKIETLEKLQIVASMIKGIDDLGLNLDSTLVILDSKVVTGTSKLKSEVDLLTTNIESFTKQDSLNSEQIKEQKLQLAKLEEERKNTDKTNKVKIADLDSQISVKEQSISVLEAKNKENQSRLILLENQHEEVKRKYEDAEIAMGILLEEKKSLSKKQKEYERVIADKESNEKNFKDALTEANAELKKAVENIEKLQSELTVSKSDNARLTNELIEMQKSNNIKVDRISTLSTEKNNLVNEVDRMKKGVVNN